jgi:hypothetical protein
MIPLIMAVVAVALIATLRKWRPSRRVHLFVVAVSCLLLAVGVAATAALGYHVGFNFLAAGVMAMGASLTALLGRNRKGARFTEVAVAGTMVTVVALFGLAMAYPV